MSADADSFYQQKKYNKHSSNVLSVW
jgi:hypothetical protein